MKKTLKILIAVLLLLGLVWTIAWFSFASIISSEVAKITNKNSNAQINITCEQFSVKGYPFNFKINCSQATFNNGDLNFSLAGFFGDYSIFSPTSAKLKAIGPLKYSNDFFASKQELRWLELNAQISLSGWKLKSANIMANDLEYVDLLIGEYLILKANNITLDLLENKKQFDRAKQLVSPFFLTKIDGFNFENIFITNGQLDIEAIISNLPADIRLWGNNDMIRNWQNNQGQVLLTSLRGKDEEKTIAISGEIGIAEVGFLDGKFAIKSNNIVELIAPNFAPKIQPLIFGSKAKDNSYSQKITIKNGKIFSGLMPIGEVPKLF